MLSPYYNITIKIIIAGQLVINAAKSIVVKSTTESLTDTAMIELPREFNLRSKSLEKKDINKVIKVGDSIVIFAGYDNDLKQEFQGYISKIGADIPLVIECEDEMYKLNQSKQITKSYKSVTLKKLLNDIIENYAIEALDMPLGKFEIKKATPYKVLEELKNKYGIRCYFKGKKMYAGLIIDLKVGEKHKFVFGKNIRDSNALKYRRKEDVKLYIKAESVKKGGGKELFEYGDKGGNEITLHAPTNLTQNGLQEFTKKTHKSRVYDGYDGNLESWGVPLTQVGDVASIRDPNYPDKHRDGDLFIKSVEVKINESDGYKRINDLAFKL